MNYLEVSTADITESTNEHLRVLQPEDIHLASSTGYFGYFEDGCHM